MTRQNPICSVDKAAEILLNEFAIVVSKGQDGKPDLKTLDSYDDLNYLVRGKVGGDGEEAQYVLKIHNHVDSKDNLDAINAQALILSKVSSVIAPRQVGENKRVTLDKGDHIVRLLTFIPGTLLKDIVDPQKDVLFNVGKALALFDQDLACIDTTQINREFIWDLRNAREAIRNLKHFFTDKERVATIGMVEDIIDRELLPIAKHLPLGVIHGDANDHNIIINAFGKPGQVGLIDLGDANTSWRVSEVAIAMVYTMASCTEFDLKVYKAKWVLEGYQSVIKLTPHEVAALYPLILARCAVSVCMSNSACIKDPANATYLAVHSEPIWKTLNFLVREAVMFV
mmetsp:Transcript_10518/g.17159  ORF Transcript_10518/g.17159 Transcript_10518/m.17159 type:complete len:341 (+) Transcript_10518:1395-2417(+)